MTTAFDYKNLKTLRRDRIKSGIISLLISALAFLLLYFVTLKKPFPPLADTTGVIVNIDVAAGAGDNTSSPAPSGGNPEQSTTTSTPNLTLTSKRSNLVTRMIRWFGRTTSARKRPK